MWILGCLQLFSQDLTKLPTFLPYMTHYLIWPGFVKTNILRKFTKDWANNVVSRVFKSYFQDLT